MGNRILVVDDEKEIADVIELYLKNEGFEVEKFYTGKDALASIEKAAPDMALLDVMLPDIDGFEVLQKIREKYNFPVIMLTAKTEYMDKINGLMLGADDYMAKPFNPLELIARVKAQIVGQVTAFEISITELKSPGLEMGNPASITSTPNASNAFAT